MPLINLIQEQRLSSRREEARTRLFLFSFVGTAVVSAFAFGFLMFKAEQAQGKVAHLEAQNQKLAPLLRQIEENNKAISILRPRLATLENAQEMTTRWSRILSHLTVNTPENTWLTGMRCNASDATKPVSISFIGMSVNQDLVGDLMLRLQGSEDLEAVDLKYTQEKAGMDGIGIEFEISGDVAGTAEEKPKREGA